MHPKTRGVWRTIALFSVALVAQIAIIALAPAGKAQTSTPPIQVPPWMTITAQAAHNIVEGEIWVPRVEFDLSAFEGCVQCPFVVGRLEEGAEFFDLSPNQGNVQLPSADRSTITLTLDAVSPGFPLDIFSIIGIQGLGTKNLVWDVVLTDTLVTVTDTVVVQPPPKIFDVRSIRPLSARSGGTYTSTIRVGAASGPLTFTRIAAQVEGVELSSVKSNLATCQVVISSFVCATSSLRPEIGPFDITVTQRVADGVRRALQTLKIDSGPNSLVLSSTTNVLAVNAPGLPPVRGDLDGDRDVDRDDLTLLLARRNMLASGPDDPADLDSDGSITVLDARVLVTLCTRSRCAVE